MKLVDTLFITNCMDHYRCHFSCVLMYAFSFKVWGIGFQLMQVSKHFLRQSWTRTNEVPDSLRPWNGRRSDMDELTTRSADLAALTGDDAVM